MEIRRIVREAVDQGELTHAAQAQLGRLVDSARELSQEDYRALVELRTAIELGTIRVASRREFRNVMEEIVSEELEALLEREGATGLDRGDLLAFTLNRLPPLYATSDVGAHYQRERARQELQGLVAEQVSVALHRAQQRPGHPLERRPLGESAGEPLLRHIASLLNRFATDYELPT